MIKSCLYTMCVLFVYCFSTVNAQASAISSPVAATDSTGISDRFDIGNTIDQSGLSVGFVSGVTDFDAYLAGNPTHVIYSLDNEWFTNRPDISATIIYDLGGVFSVDRLALWNEESAGIGFFDISTSLDNAIFTPVASGLIPVDNPLDTNYGAEVFDFSTQAARYIQLDIGGCPQPDGFDHENCGIGEVAFSTSPIPIPAATWLFGSGLLGLIGISRRKRSA